MTSPETVKPLPGLIVPYPPIGRFIPITSVVCLQYPSWILRPVPIPRESHFIVELLDWGNASRHHRARAPSRASPHSPAAQIPARRGSRRCRAISTCRRADDFSLPVIIHAAVAAQDPNQPRVVVALSQPLAINFSIGHGEQRLAVLHVVMPVTSPGRQEANLESALVRRAHDIIDLVPVIIGRLWLHVGAGGIEVDQRQVPIGVRGRITVPSARDGEPLPTASGAIVAGKHAQNSPRAPLSHHVIF